MMRPASVVIACVLLGSNIGGKALDGPDETGFLDKRTGDFRLSPTDDALLEDLSHRAFMFF